MAAWLRHLIVPADTGATRPNRKTRFPPADSSFPWDALPEIIFGEPAPGPAYNATPEDGVTPAPYVSSLTQSERHFAHAARLNLLLVATDVDPPEVLPALRWDCHEPMTTWTPGDVLVLPANAQGGTLLLEDISALALEDQRRLYGWLDTSPEWMQVVSITSRSLLPYIQAGAFLERLYYRLNIVCGEIARTRPVNRPDASSQ